MSDNILAAVLGALEGAQKSTDYFLQETMARRRRKEEMEENLALYKAKQPLEAAARRQGLIDQATIDLQSKSAFLPLQEESTIRINEAKNNTTSKIPVAKSRALELAASGTPLPPRSIIVDDTAANKMTTEGSKVAGNLRDGMRSIDSALLTLDEKPNLFRKAGLSLPLLGDTAADIASIGDPDAQNLKREIGNAADIIKRYRSGAAVTPSEGAFYTKLLNNIWVTPENAKKNLSKVRQFFGEVEADLQSGKRRFNETIGESQNPYEGLDFTQE